MIYRFEENQDDKKVKDKMIEKDGVVVHFTLSEVEQHQAKLEQAKKEITATREVESAKMTNIEENHPFVKEMSEQDLFTAQMYQDSKTIVKMADDKLDEIEKQIEAYKEEVAEIKKQLKIEDEPTEPTK